MAKRVLPAKRVYHSILHDPITDRLLLFGGQAFYHWGMDLQDVWSFDFNASRWEFLGPLEAGEVYSVAYDDSRRLALMLNLKGETWAYAVGTGEWEKRNPPQAPPARFGHRMIYEAHTGHTLLFGGIRDSNVNAPPMNDTWIYDYGADRWTLMDTEPRPPARLYHSMVYHPAAERTLIWGGRPFSERDDVAVWTYDSRSNMWTALPHSAGPEKRYTYATMVYCPQSDRIVMFGGLELSGQFEGRLVDETWLFDLSTNRWQRAEVTDCPPARSQQAMAFSPLAGKAIVMGGEIGAAYSGEFCNDLWLYDPTSNRWDEVRS